MSKVVKIAAASLTLFALFNGLIQEKAQVEVEAAPWMADECTEALEVECAVDIERTVKACSAAFETGGADIIADIKCTKDLMADKKHCWPCICKEAQKRGWKIIGC